MLRELRDVLAAAPHEHAGQTKGEGLTDFGPPFYAVSFYAVSPAGAVVVK